MIHTLEPEVRNLQGCFSRDLSAQPGPEIWKNTIRAWAWKVLSFFPGVSLPKKASPAVLPFAALEGVSAGAFPG